MNFAQRHKRLADFRSMLEPDKGGSGGGGGGAKTIEEQLSETRSQVSAKDTEIGSLKLERDTAKSEAANLKNQFDAATKAANEAKEELGRVKAELATANTEKAGLATKLNSTAENVTRLETLCGVKGVDANSTPAAVSAGGGTNSEHVFDQWSKASGGEKTSLWRKHHAEIRAEGERRQKEARRA